MAQIHALCRSCPLWHPSVWLQQIAMLLELIGEAFLVFLLDEDEIAFGTDEETAQTGIVGEQAYQVGVAG